MLSDDRGDFPHEDQEPTPDQLSAVHQLIRAGVPPYVDFSLFGPHGRRMLRKLHLVAQRYDPSTGTWRRQELPGPPCFDSWWRCWLVFKCCLILLKESKPEPLDLYGELIRDLSQRYGPSCWFLIYQADVRMRSEELDRIRRRRLIAMPAGTLPTLKWGDLILESTKCKDFWDSEVREKALLYLGRVRSRTETTSDGTALLHIPSIPAVPPPVGNPRGAKTTEATPPDAIRATSPARIERPRVLHELEQRALRGSMPTSKTPLV